MVVSMINLGAYIAAEATLSFLGIGLVAAGGQLGCRDLGFAPYIRHHPVVLSSPASSSR
jgi:oligopeptide transport system permease protein